MAEALQDSSDWSAKWVLKSDLANTDLLNVDLVVILRQTEKDGILLDFIKKVHLAGLKVLFDLDDLVFDYKDLLILMKGTNSKNIAYWAGYIWGIRRIAKKADGFITTNEFLAGKLKRSFNKPCGVIPNSLNSEQIKVADESLEDKKHGGFAIGYFSGSPTHTKDLKLVEPEIFRFLDEHKDAKLRIVGYMELSSEMQRRVKNGQVEICDLVDYLEQIKMMSKVDVNIAPLVISEFTNCKSELKFFEAAVVETITIASPTYAFKKAISDGKNGFLAQPGEWYDKLGYLYNNPSENRKIAKAARKYALENHYGKKFVKEVEEAYRFFCN
ncbi:glycosyltransferase [Candidatus Saccharibacteria bacterium]|nr:glycosyltransferase [Candidatus Saccharibacteria bacterium]